MKTTQAVLAKEKKWNYRKKVVLLLMSMGLMVWIFMLMVMTGASKVGLVTP